MKKQLPLILGMLGVATLFFMSCGHPDFCINCEDDGAVKTTVSYGKCVDGKDSAVTIYAVMTPRNYNYCDSFVFYKGTYVEPWRVNPNLLLCTQEEAQRRYLAGDNRCVCRINPDIDNNDISEINDFFYIEGITKFPNNRLYIKTLNDTSKIRAYEDYSNNNNMFNGLVIDTVDTEYPMYRMLATGIYVYELILYKDEMHTVPFDTITGNFAIIRSDKDCNSRCIEQAKDQNDTKILK